jgi:hypothetical protein
MINRQATHRGGDGNMKARTQALAASRWPWLNRVFVSWAAAMVALFLGILTFAAVRETSIECRREPNYLLTAKGDRLALGDGSGYLLLEEESLRCRLGAGDRFVTLP